MKDLQQVTKDNLGEVVEELSRGSLHEELEAMLQTMKKEQASQEKTPCTNQYMTGNRVGKLAVLDTYGRVLEGILSRHPKESAS